jgi:hypothetical protein
MARFGQNIMAYRKSTTTKSEIHITDEKEEEGVRARARARARTLEKRNIGKLSPL